MLIKRIKIICLVSVFFVPIVYTQTSTVSERDRLLSLYRDKKLHDVSTADLIALSNILSKLNQHKEAARLQNFAWQNFVQQGGSMNESVMLDTERGLLGFSEIQGNYLPASNLELIQENLIELSASDEQGYQALMTWALRHQQYEWVRYLLSRKGNQEIPIWIQEAIALRQNDLYQLDKLLKENLEEIPYRDRVLIAQKLGYKRMAQQLAYRGVREHPSDSQIHDIFSTIELQDSPYVIVDPYYRNNGEIAGPGLQWRLRIIMTPRINIFPFGDIWKIRSTDEETIVAPTNIDHLMGLEIREKIRRGERRYIIGGRHGLKDFLFGTFVLDYQLIRKVNMLAELSYNKKATDSTALLVAGMKNEARLTLQWMLTRYDALISMLGYQYFKSQDNVHLGSGESLDLVYYRKLFRKYPDWNIAVFGAIQQYQENGRLSDTASAVIPPNETKDVSFYMPDSFIRYGASIGFGQPYKAGYTQFWRPFWQVSVFNTTTSGIGNLIEAGIAGTVLGLDHLALFLARSSDLEGEDQVDRFIGLRYQLYF